MSLLKPHFPKWAPLEQADFLIGIDSDLAGIIAGCEFEVRIKQLIDPDKPTRHKKIRQFRQKLLPKPHGQEWGHLETMVEYVVRQNKNAYREYEQEFQHVRELRNQAIHGERLLEGSEIKLMIDVTTKLPEGRMLQRLM